MSPIHPSHRTEHPREGFVAPVGAFLGAVFSGRFRWLLASLVILMFVAPLYGGVRLVRLGAAPLYVGDVINFCFLIVAIATYHRRRLEFWSLVVLVVVAQTTGLAARFAPEPGATALGVGSLVAAGCVMLSIALLISSDVFSRTQVDGDAICGSISVYMLAGVVFAAVYSMILLASPEQFRIADGLAAEDPSLGPHRLMLYFSLTTLTTVGYGDITPLGDLPRSLANAEAIFGQAYLTVLVARLVGQHLARRPESTPSEDAARPG